MFDGKNLHSTRDNEGLYNSENLGETPTATASVNMFYNEIKDYDFNNQGQNSLAQGGKVVGRPFQFINLKFRPNFHFVAKGATGLISSTSGHLKIMTMTI